MYEDRERTAVPEAFVVLNKFLGPCAYDQDYKSLDNLRSRMWSKTPGKRPKKAKWMPQERQERDKGGSFASTGCGEHCRNPVRNRDVSVANTRGDRDLLTWTGIKVFLFHRRQEEGPECEEV